MASISRKIKEALYSKSTPDFLFDLYFNWKNAKDKKRLFSALESNADLLDHVSEVERTHWRPRIKDVLESQDNQDIPRDELAGQLLKGYLYMHNGIKIDPLSYYNYPMLKMLMDNKGVHEPQEEKIFQKVLDSLPMKGQKTMLELGAYWSFYSIWFKKKFSTSSCFMVEPNRRNLMYGKENLKLNNVKGTFIHAGISKEVDQAANITTVDEICKEQKIEFLDILHSDIQGYELEMLHGSQQMFAENRVGYVFVSTHSNDLHRNCRKLLKDKYNFSTVASADLDETYSWDGVLVMKAPNYPGIEKVNISKKKAAPKVSKGCVINKCRN